MPGDGGKPIEVIWAGAKIPDWRKNMKLLDFADRIEGRSDFKSFLSLLARDLATRGDEWENDTLDEFIPAMERFVGDIDGFYKNRDEGVDLSRPTWRTFAHILLAARVYE